MNHSSDHDNTTGSTPFGRLPRNREELHRWDWQQHAPGILAAMNIPAGTDPGRVPDELRNTAPIEWPDDEDGDYLEPEDIFDDEFPDEVTAARVTFSLLFAERDERLRESRQFRQVKA